MITLTFSVRPEQGGTDEFDLGDVICEGESGSVGSAGRVPDQGMMLYLSVPLLLDALRPLVAGGRKAASFVGIGSSFRLDFRRDRDAVVTVSANGTLVGSCRPGELAEAVLRPAEELERELLSQLPAESGAARDLASSLERFRVAASPGLRARSSGGAPLGASRCQPGKGPIAGDGGHGGPLK
ncbi:hypothetical protein MIU24_09025 [Streptomyces venezuelae]|uniref:hypothetical protein n=1 Tax=Streptomyces sp. B6(2022) TaxID=3404749 RepID=UPI00311D9E28